MYMTASTKVTVVHDVGLHARPAAIFVQTASQFESDIQVSNLTSDKGPVNAKSVLLVLTLGVEKDFEIDIEGTGIVIMGGLNVSYGEADSYVAEVEVYVNEDLKEVVTLPADFRTRKFDIFWDYELGQVNNSVRLKWNNPVDGRDINVGNVLVFMEE